MRWSSCPASSSTTLGALGDSGGYGTTAAGSSSTRRFRKSASCGDDQFPVEQALLRFVAVEPAVAGGEPQCRYRRVRRLRSHRTRRRAGPRRHPHPPIVRDRLTAPCAGRPLASPAPAPRHRRAGNRLRALDMHQRDEGIPPARRSPQRRERGRHPQRTLDEDPGPFVRLPVRTCRASVVATPARTRCPVALRSRPPGPRDSASRSSQPSRQC